MKILKLRSPAKVNFRLDVLGRRPDGYHDIRMLNSAVSIYDDIEVELIDKGIEVECSNDLMVPSGEANIVYRAAKEVMAYSNKNVGIRVCITKAIPSGAGMGGGSSNAASVLAGLNQLLKIQLTREKLMKIGLRFGADIPFFLYGSPAIATGIGENLMKLKKLPHMPLVIVSPNLNVPTGSIYEKFRPNGNGSHDVVLPREFSTKKTVIKFLNNDLEAITSRQYPIITEIKRLLVKFGALGAQMTGSGPSVFGIFPDKDSAEKAGKKLIGKGEGAWKVFVAENI